MISTRRSAKYTALLAGSALVLAACATSDEPTDEEVVGGGESAETDATTEAAPSDAVFTYGYEQEFFAYNNDQGDANAGEQGHARILPLQTPSGPAQSGLPPVELTPCL